jgi:hypothetical protein
LMGITWYVPFSGVIVAIYLVPMTTNGDLLCRHRWWGTPLAPLDTSPFPTLFVAIDANGENSDSFWPFYPEIIYKASFF